MIPDHPGRDYRRLQVLVMGLGTFGGGLGAVRFLASRGARLTVTDARPAEKLADALQQLQDERDITFKLGGHDQADFERADLVVVNPAVRRDHPCLQAARAAGIPITSEMNLFWQWNPAPVVAVTGSNGKSTTTALIHSILKHSSRRAWLGGNLGISLLPQVDQIRPEDIVVLELSSFQLADLDRLQASPAVAVVTNFAPNHLDWHESLDDYRSAKQTLLRWQSPTDCAVLNGDDPDVCRWPAIGRKLLFGLRDTGEQGIFAQDSGAVVARLPDGEQQIPLGQWLKLPGRHNLANALAAACAAHQAGASFAMVQKGLELYQPLPHRLEWIADVEGRSFYNDSLATTPESAIVALEAFDRPVILLAGGYDKHVDLTLMAQAIARRAKGAALMGQTASVLRNLILAAAGCTCTVSDPMTSFRQSLDWAVAQSEPGDVILLSPGCASYDWFLNFADRGEQFRAYANSMQAEVAAGRRAIRS